MGLDLVCPRYLLRQFSHTHTNEGNAHQLTTIAAHSFMQLVSTPDSDSTSIMSELQRSFAKAKLAGLPFEPPSPINTTLEDDEDDYEQVDNVGPLPEQAQDDDSSSASSASSASSTGTIRPSPSKHLFARPRGSVISSFV